MKETTQRQSLLSSLIVMGSTLGTRLLGFVRMALISALFGGGGQVDVLNWAFSIPNNFRKLLAEGALSSAFIPEISRQLVDDPSGREAKRLARNLMGFLLCVILPLSLLFALFPQGIVRLLSDFEDPVKSLEAGRLMQWTFHYLLLVSLSALFMGILNSHNRFFIPAITPLLFSISVITSLILFYKTLGIYAMAVGVLGGGLMQILFQLPAAGKLGYMPIPAFHFKNPAFRRVLRRWLPIMLSASIFALNQQIAHYFATRLEEGSMTALSNALVYWQLPFGIFFNSISTVTYPKISRQYSRKDFQGMGETVLFGYSALISLLLPSAMLLMLMGPEVIAITLQRGAYRLEHTLLASQALFAYATGLLSVGLYNFTQRVFHAMGNVRTPLYTSIFILISDVALTLWFILKLDMGVQGLAYANTLAFSMGFLLLLWQLRKKIPLGHLTGRIVKDWFGVLASMVLLGAWLWGFRRWLGYQWWQEGSSWRSWTLTAAEGIGALVFLLGGFFLFRVSILSILRNRGDVGEKV